MSPGVMLCVRIHLLSLVGQGKTITCPGARYPVVMPNLEKSGPKSAREWTQLDIATGLRTLALYGGNVTRAAAALKAEGKPISTKVLASWKNEKYAVQYEDIVYELRQSIGQKISDDAMEVAAAASGVEAALIAETQRQLADIPAKDLAKSALNMAQIKRNNVETARLLRNEPTQITETRSVDESLDELRALGVIDVEAEEIE